MSEAGEGLYNDYFRLRGVNKATYHSYELPVYLHNQLKDSLDASILDVGCGFGQMLFALKKAGATKLQGVELLAEAAEYCNKELGINVECTSDIDTFAKQHAGSYDVILMSHVLEHIPREKTIDTLKAIRSMLKPGGKFIVMVPNGQAPVHSYWMWEDFTHCLLFTAGSMLYVLKAAGFTQVEFLDPHDLEGKPFIKRIFKQFFQGLYRAAKNFWNSINSSGYHYASPVIYTWELKVLAR